jgi:type I restriction enzyme S subunit
VSVSEWREVRLGDLVTFQRGHDLPKAEMKEGPYPVVGSNGIIGYHSKYTTEAPCITIGRSGNVGNPFLSKCKTWAHNTTLYIKEFKNTDPIYIYYLLKTLDLGYYAVGSAVPTLNRNHIHPILISVPESIEEQRSIAATLSALDDMIELNNQINKTLEEMAQAIFKSWFVDFEPFKNGEFEESELGLIPKGWRVGVLGDIIDIFDSKRVPLSNRQRSVMEKKYPYYGAATLMDYVDNYIFDGVYVLLGEDGTVMDEKGYPILQYVWGKFWVNNHAHVLKGKGVFSDEYLYILLKNTNVASIVTGAVQLKINQNNLTGLKIIIPPEDVVKQYNDVVKDIFACFRSNTDEIKILTSLRDTLLPKLMSGEIRVPVE